MNLLRARSGGLALVPVVALLALIIHTGRWLPRSVPRIAVTAEILVSGYDCDLACGPGAGGSTGPRGFPQVAGIGSVLVSPCPVVR
jgi:hypothetical protein